ncbi:MAG: DNA-protecting protein DprA [Bacteroidia bacterium]|nr:DNA-protecting protein DprA [Bacteroidia bacterium]
MLFKLSDSELYYQMALTLVPGVGPIMGKHLIGYCGSAEAVFYEKKSRLSKIPNVGLNSAANIYQFKDFDFVDRELEFIDSNHIRAIHYTSEEYPLRLKQELDSPLVLFIKGSTNLNHHRMLAIVGTRKNTQAGAAATKKLVEGLRSYDVNIISGLAYGIDIAAHKACIENDIPTIAVVAHGLDVIYPGQHKGHAKKMIEHGGCIVTEHFSGTALNPDLFPRRNRIVAALCDGIVVVESLKRGGSMITADIASGYNRDVFAIPGRPSDPMSEGCNYLIKSLKAQMCETAEDIAQSMNWDIEIPDNPKIQNQAVLFAEFTEEEKMVADSLFNGERTYDDLFISTQIPVNKLSYLLLDLEMRGIVRSMPGKKYALTR